MLPSACLDEAPSPVECSCACKKQRQPQSIKAGPTWQMQDAHLLCSSYVSCTHQCSQQHTCELHRDPGIVLLCPGDVAPEGGCVQKLPAVFPGRCPAGLVHGQHVLAQRPVLQPGGVRSATCAPVGPSEQHSQLCVLTAPDCAVSARCGPMGPSEQRKRCTVSACTAPGPAARVARCGLSACLALHSSTVRGTQE